ncbi:hypothetical protein JCM5353_005993 [Sporobolomyces roseus]
MSKQSLSKGTLGLKFMNRTIPPSTPPQPQSTPIDKGKQPATTETTTTRRPTITHDSSLLSFPLLSNSFASTSTSTSSNFSTSTYYNSMPLTSSAISGRRSFGGANIEIEKLNDPASHPAPQPNEKETEKEKDSKSSLKKKQRELPISGRRQDLSGGNKKVLKRLSEADEQHETEKRRKFQEGGGGGMKEAADGNWDLGKNEDQVSFSSNNNNNSAKEFRKPVGFEGVKKQSRQRRGEGGMMDETAHKWGKKGSVREWDQDKEAELGSEEEDQRVLDGLDSDSESESSESSGDDDEGSDGDDEAAIREMLMSAKALDRKRDASSGTSKQKKETIEREMRRDEEGMMGERQGSGPSKGGKKQGRGGGGGGTGPAKRGKSKR